MTMMAEKDERYQGVQKHSSGFKLLASMGWKEGEGLGANRQGMKHHIKVKKTHDNAGIGLAEAARKAKDWTVGMAAYDQVLAKLKNVTSPPATDTATPEMDMNKKRKHSKVSESEGCGDADAGQSAKGKKKAKSSKEASIPEQGIVSAAEEILNFADTAPLAGSGSRAEAVAKAETATVARASHLARFGRRRAGKNVQSYSGSDLAAILGENAVAAVSTKEARSEPGQAVRRLVVDVSDRISVIQEALDDQQEQPGDAQKWWYSTFHRSGRLGSNAPQPVPETSSKPKIKITGFSEDDQTNLYNMAHETSGKGKQGLGIASRPKKVAGARWQGSKKRIEEESSDDEEQAAAAEEQVQPAELPESEDCSEDTHVSSGQNQQHEEQEAGQRQSQTLLSQSAVSGKQNGSAIVLVKSARRVLKAVPGGQLRQKKLEKRVLDLLAVQRGSSARKEMRRALLAAIGGSTKVKMHNGLVSL